MTINVIVVLNDLLNETMFTEIWFVKQDSNYDYFITSSDVVLT